MNKAQNTALENQCRLACETVHPQFDKIHQGYYIRLTVNSGYE